MINVSENSTVTINGGTFTNAANYSTIRIWCSDDDDTIVTINEGTFNGAIDFHNVSANPNKGTLTINGGTFTGNHGVVGTYGAGSEATLNAGTFNCTATYTGNSDWVLYAEEGGIVKYNASSCTLTTGNTSGPVYGAQVGTSVIAF